MTDSTEKTPGFILRIACMKKKLYTINVGFISNAYATQVIEERVGNGWGIDAMVEDPMRNTWITFYKYKKASKGSDLILN